MTTNVSKIVYCVKNNNTIIFLKSQNKYFIVLFILLFVSFLIQKNNFILSNNLDTSWMFTLNYAVSNNYLFGKEIIFTFGPLGFLGYPITEGLNNILIVVSYIIKGIYLLYIGIVLYEITLSIKFIKSKELSYLFKYILLPWLVIKLGFYVDYTVLIFIALVHSSISILERNNRLPRFFYNKYNNKLAIIIFNSVTSIVLLFLKVSFFPFVVVFLVLIIISLILFKDYLNLFLYLIFSYATFVIIYVCFNIDFTAYITNSIEIISGYKKSMQIYEGEEYDKNYFAAAIITLIFITQLYRIKKSFYSYEGIAKLTLILLAFYYCFSYSFTRGSSSLFFKCSVTSIVIFMAIYLTKSTDHKNRIYSVAIIALTFGFFNNFYNDLIFLTNWNYDQYRYKDRIPARLLDRSKTYDVYPNLTSISYFNNLTYVPRPVFQSYSSYTPKLDSINSLFISKKKVDYIIFHNKLNNIPWGNTIDERYFLFEEPLTKIEILKKYSINDSINNSMFIAKKRIKNVNIKFKLISKRSYEINSVIHLNSIDSTKLYFFTANFRYSYRATVLSLFYKLPYISVEITKNDKSKERFNIVSDLLNHQCVLNKYCSDYYDYFKLFQRENFKSLPNIKSIKFMSDQKGYINNFDFAIYEATLF